MKKFSDFITESTNTIVTKEETLDEGKRVVAAYDVSDFPEDGLDDLMWALGSMGRARQGTDWDFQHGRRGQVHLILFTPKGKKAAEKFFGRNAKELINSSQYPTMGPDPAMRG